MISLPLFYHGQIVSHARVDDSFESLRQLRWLCDIPGSIRRSCKRPDIILATLIEDTSKHRLLNPIIYWNQRTIVFLKHVVAIPQLVPIILGNQPATRPQVQNLVLGISKVIFTDGDRTNCTRENLRLITKLPTIDPALCTTTNPG